MLNSFTVATALGLLTGGAIAYAVTRDLGATAAGATVALLIVTGIRFVVESLSP